MLFHAFNLNWRIDLNNRKYHLNAHVRAWTDYEIECDKFNGRKGDPRRGDELNAPDERFTLTDV